MGTHRAQNRAPKAHNSQHCGSVGWVRVCRALGGAPSAQCWVGVGTHCSPGAHPNNYLWPRAEQAGKSQCPGVTSAGAALPGSPPPPTLDRSSGAHGTYRLGGMGGVSPRGLGSGLGVGRVWGCALRWEHPWDPQADGGRWG